MRGERSPVKQRDVPSSTGRNGASEDIVYSDSEDWFNLNHSSEKQCSVSPIRPVNKFLRIGAAGRKIKRDSYQGRHRNLFIGSQFQKENAMNCNDHAVSSEKSPTKHNWWEEASPVLIPSDQPEKRNGNPESLVLTGTHGTFIGKRFDSKRDEGISRNLPNDSDTQNTLGIQKFPGRDLEEEYARIGKVDGLNVIACRHPTANANLPGKKASNSGWGKNFVKLDIRVSYELWKHE